MLTSHPQKLSVPLAVLIMLAPASVVCAQSAPRAGDRTFDADNPSQPIEGHTPPPDIVFRREGPVEIGHLQSLLAFATLFDDDEVLQQRASATAPADGEGQSGTLPATTPSDERPGLPGTHIPRDEIGLILLDGKSFPAEPPAMPLDEDSVLLDSGEVLTGMVMVTGGEVYVAGQTVPVTDVTLIRLKNEEEQAPVRTPPPTEEDSLSPYWTGTIVFRNRDMVFRNAPNQTNPHGDVCTEVTTVKWKMALTEKVIIEDLSSQSYVLMPRIRFRRDGERESVKTGFCMTWGAYEIETHDLRLGETVIPNPYRISGLYKPQANDLSHPAGEPMLGHAGYYSQDLEDLLVRRHEENPHKVSFKWCRSGIYDLITPLPNPDEQGWPKQKWVDRNNRIVGEWTPLYSGSVATRTDQESSDFPYNVMTNQYQRMTGRRTNDYIEEGVLVDCAEWDFRRVDRLPPPPEFPAPEMDNCTFYRQQLEGNQINLDVWQSQINWLKLIRDLIITRQEEQLREELDGLRYAVWEARINSEYYKQKLAGCEAAQADPDAAETPLEPEPDLRVRLQEYYGLDP